MQKIIRPFVKKIKILIYFVTSTFNEFQEKTDLLFEVYIIWLSTNCHYFL